MHGGRFAAIALAMVTLLQFFKKKFGGDQKLHPIDRQMAKRWIKKRLCVVFPELRNDPRALEQAYRALSLEPRLGSEEGDAGVYFEMKLPETR